MWKKIYSIGKLIYNFFNRRQRSVLSFEKEDDGRWYYVFKNWGFAHGNLEMVAGADALCEKFSGGTNHTTVEVIATDVDTIGLHVKRPTPEMILSRDFNERMGYTVFEGEEFPKEWGWRDRHIWGRTYHYVDRETKEESTMWICPVTLFVLGRYPKYLYIRKYDNTI